jgi:hypothetical protein
MVFVLNISMVITFVTVECAVQLVFQRMTQVLTVVMISHMFLNLKGSNSPAQEETESHDMPFGSLIEREKVDQALGSLDAWLSGAKMSSIVGTLGNDLVHSSLSDY